MRVLYYAVAYHSESGARTHAQAFLAQLSRQPGVTQAILFPATPGSDAERSEVGSPVPDRKTRRGAATVAKRMQNSMPPILETQLRLRWPNPWEYRDLAAAVSREHADAVVLRLGTRFQFLRWLRRDYPNLKVCVEFNASPFDEDLKDIPGETHWRREEIASLQSADCVSVVSEYLLEYLVSRCPALETRVFVNPNGADPTVFAPPTPSARAKSRQMMGCRDDAFVVGYAGGMQEWRRLPAIIGSVAKAKRQGLGELFLALAGDGEDMPSVRQALVDHQTDLLGHVYLSGQWLDASDIPPLMAGFDAGLLSYAYPHGCHQKAFEYLSMGLPVIGPSASLPAEIDSRDYGVFTFDPDEDGLPALLAHVGANLSHCRNLASDGRALVESTYTWRANASRVVGRLFGETLA